MFYSVGQPRKGATGAEWRLIYGVGQLCGRLLIKLLAE